MNANETRAGLAAILSLAVLSTLAAFAASTAVQSQRLIAANLSVDAPPAASTLASIWQDRLRAEKTKLASLPKVAGAISAPSVPVFYATFKEGEKAIIVSALFTTPECQNFAGAASPNLNKCPMRVAVIRGDEVKTVVTDDDFPFVSTMKQASDKELPQYDNQDPANKTIVNFNPTTREITTSLTLNGVPDSEQSPVFHIPAN